MSMLIPVSINGVEYEAHGEYTAAAVAQDFKNSLTAFSNVFTLEVGTGPGQINPNPPTLPTGTGIDYVQELKNALTGGVVTLSLGPPPVTATVTGMIKLLNDPADDVTGDQDGLDVVNDPVLGNGRYYLSVEMATALNELIASLKAAGIQFEADGRTPILGSITEATVLNWRNLAATSTVIQEVLRIGIEASEDSNRTLQALVELVYVRTGNELLADNLEELEEALTTTRKSIEALTGLQDLHNNITAVNREKFDKWLNLGNEVERVANPDCVTEFASAVQATDQNTPAQVSAGTPAHFTPIDPQLLSALTETQKSDFLSIRLQLQERIRELSANTPVADRNDPAALVAKLSAVLGDINKAFSAVLTLPGAISGATSGHSSTVTKALTRWILDSYGDNSAMALSLDIPGIEPGEIQRNLTAAITAGQSVNDTQKEEVRRYMFVFEEYYKSAAAILTKITQIIERMAQAIAR